MVEQSEFYQSHLDRVSRSFAFCIRQLSEPLRTWVGLSYLLCRIVDTVEDSPWVSKPSQKEAFTLFDQALLDPAQSDRLHQWSAAFTSEIKEGEKILLDETDILLQDLHALPRPVRDLITELVHSMSLGMQHFTSRSDDLRLATLAEVNQYCFFVAGLVGELLVKLLSKVDASFVLDESALLRAHHFGLFLQKVNLLKDQSVDEEAGRHLIPSREMVAASAETNASAAFEFLLALPESQVEFRRFCAWSLFLGLESVHVAHGRRVVKVSRERMAEILSDVESALTEPAVFVSMFSVAIAKLGWKQVPMNEATAQVDLPDWLLRGYRGSLPSTALGALGLA